MRDTQGILQIRKLPSISNTAYFPSPLPPKEWGEWTGDEAKHTLDVLAFRAMWRSEGSPFLWQNFF